MVEHTIDASQSESGSLHKVSSAANMSIKRQSAASSAKTSVGKAEYIGLCLPVDVNMIFQV